MKHPCYTRMQVYLTICLTSDIDLSLSNGEAKRTPPPPPPPSRTRTHTHTHAHKGDDELLRETASFSVQSPFLRHRSHGGAKSSAGAIEVGSTVESISIPEKVTSPTHA